MRCARIVRLLFIGLTLVLAGCIERMFFYPDAARYSSPDREGVRAEDVELRGAAGV